MSVNKLSRFTTLPFLLDILINEHLVFSDPKNWPDKNDSEIIEIYEQNKKHKSKKDIKLFVLCFLIGNETIHHWSAFADGISGCCIEFDKAGLEKIFSAKKSNGVRFGKVDYRKIKEEIDDCADMIPFQKRDPYKIENEFRVVWEKTAEEKQCKIKIPLKVITKVTLSPNMPEPLFKTTEAFFKEHFDVPVNPSTLYRNSVWIKKFEEKFKASTAT
ncbi:MAG TPA: DUF2971 domain-containing protein [Verrucomicrobiae bacterium]